MADDKSINVTKVTVEPFPDTAFWVMLLGSLGAMYTLPHGLCWVAGLVVGFVVVRLVPKNSVLLFEPSKAPESERRRFLLKVSLWGIEVGVIFPLLGYFLSRATDHFFSRVVLFLAPLPSMFFVLGGLACALGIYGLFRSVRSRKSHE